MKEKTTLADRYLYEHFYESCTVESKLSIGCPGVELDADYLSVSLDVIRIADMRYLI